MTYQEFKQQVRSAVQKALGSGVTVTIQDIIKNNDTHLDGLTVLSTQCNISPTIYLNYYFRQYEKGTSFSEICRQVLKAYDDNRAEDSIDISFFTEYDKVKSRIIFKLINYEKNKEMLESIPHYRFLDLAIVFCCLLESSPAGNATILIFQHHLKFWSITKDDLYALAAQNTPKLLSYDLRNMSDILKELMTDADAACIDSGRTTAVPMYVLSNQLKLNGSVCILYHNLLKEFADRMESDLYILPSSIHEVLIIPARYGNSYEDLSDMVREVNASQLSGEEVLSDHVYYFSRDTCQITM